MFCYFCSYLCLINSVQFEFFQSSFYIRDSTHRWSYCLALYQVIVLYRSNFSFQRRVPLSFNAFVRDNLCEYHHGVCCKKSRFFGLYFFTCSMGLTLTEFIEMVNAKWPLCCSWSLILISVKSRMWCARPTKHKIHHQKRYIFLYGMIRKWSVSRPPIWTEEKLLQPTSDRTLEQATRVCCHGGDSEYVQEPTRSVQRVGHLKHPASTARHLQVTSNK